MGVKYVLISKAFQYLFVPEFLKTLPNNTVRSAVFSSHQFTYTHMPVLYMHVLYMWYLQYMWAEFQASRTHTHTYMYIHIDCTH